MKNNNSSGSSAGFGFCAVLGIVFIVLKLIGKITWPWIWVLAPLWIPPAFGVAYTAVVLSLIAIHNRKISKRIKGRMRNARH